VSRESLRGRFQDDIHEGRCIKGFDEIEGKTEIDIYQF
jgi:hypothetical protein